MVMPGIATSIMPIRTCTATIAAGNRPATVFVASGIDKKEMVITNAWYRDGIAKWKPQGWPMADSVDVGCLARKRRK